jgi:hypothetical protein
MSIEELCNEIKSEARTLDVPTLKVAGGKALSSHVDAGTSRNQGRNDARGKRQSKKVNVDCHNCGKHVYMARDCRAHGPAMHTNQSGERLVQVLTNNQRL